MSKNGQKRPKIQENSSILTVGKLANFEIATVHQQTPRRLRCGLLLCIVKVSRNSTEFGLSLAQPCALRAVALTVHQQTPRRLRCGVLLCARGANTLCLVRRSVYGVRCITIRLLIFYIRLTCCDSFGIINILK